MSSFAGGVGLFFSKKKGEGSAGQVVKDAPKAVSPEGAPPVTQTSENEGRLLIDSYTVNEPFARVGISLEPDGSKRYVVIEPRLTKSEKKVFDDMKEALKHGLNLDASRFKPEEADEYLASQTREIMKKFGIRIPKYTYEKLFYFIERDFLHYGKIDPLMRDPNVEDIGCNGPGSPLFVFHRTYESLETNVLFKTQEELERFVLRMAYKAGRQISVAEPVIDAALPDGNRLQLTFGSEITKKGSTFSIRKFREDPYSIVDLVKFGTLSPEVAATLWYCLENKGSILISGGTASGKTTSINCLALFIRPEAKIVTIEDTPEINLAHVNWIQSVSRQGVSGVGEVTLYDLLRAALRQRPDFIIVGEVRGEEAQTLFQALSTGHSGISSIHADSIGAVLHRLTNPPMNIPRTLIPAVNFMVQQGRITVKNVPARRIFSVTEVVGVDTRTNELITNEVYAFNPDNDALEYSGRSYTLEKFARAKNILYEDVRREIATRRHVVEWMVQANMRKYREVASVIQRYYTDQHGLLAEIGAIGV